MNGGSTQAGPGTCSVISGGTCSVIGGPNGVLWLWPERTFEQVAGEIEPTLNPAVEQMDFDDLTFPETHRLDIDAAGRIRLPQELLAEAGLGSRVLLVGMRHHSEFLNLIAWGSAEGQKRRRSAGFQGPAGAVRRSRQRNYDVSHEGA